MLAEYARWPLFRTVGIDSFFYAPPNAKTLHSLRRGPPGRLRVREQGVGPSHGHTFANPREQARWGQANPDWLNAELFTNEVIGPMREHFAGHIGPLVLEFQTIARKDGFDARRVCQGGWITSSLPSPRMSPTLSRVRTRSFYHRSIRGAADSMGGTRLQRLDEDCQPSGKTAAAHDSITAPFIVARALLRSGRTSPRRSTRSAP